MITRFQLQRIASFAGILLFFFSARAESSDSSQARKFAVASLYVENDTFANEDGHYTNGFKLAGLSPDLSAWAWDPADWRKAFVEALPFVNNPEAQKNLGVALGQNIYTPQEIATTVPDPGDRPYAGWTYLEVSFVSKTEGKMDTLAFQMGMVGRHSYAQDFQTTVHRWIGSQRPNGWAYQIKDELGVNAVWERKWRLYGRAFTETLGVDLVPHAGASLGNVQTYVNCGATARIGLNLPSDFGVSQIGAASATNSPLDDVDPRVAATRSWSLFVFGGADGRAVARDIFLDGNTFRESRSVAKEALVADLTYGLGVVLGRWQFTYTQAERSREFKLQPHANYFGSITISRVL